MKFRLTFKTPDVLDQLDFPDENFKFEMEQFIDQWIKHTEYITIEFDTKKSTCEVVKR